MAVQIQLRRDSAADWTSANPTLAQGEVGFETDTYKFKIGNGVTPWNGLIYQGGSGGGGGAVDSVNGMIGVVLLDTGDISEVIDKRYITDAQQTILGNTSGNNTGDQSAAEVPITDTGGLFTATDVEGALAELFTSVSDGKTEIAVAITGKGGTASGNDTFTELSTAITGIPTGSSAPALPIYNVGVVCENDLETIPIKTIPSPPLRTAVAVIV